jgi:hypothetical protein
VALAGIATDTDTDLKENKAWGYDGEEEGARNTKPLPRHKAIAHEATTSIQKSTAVVKRLHVESLALEAIGVACIGAASPALRRQPRCLLFVVDQKECDGLPGRGREKREKECRATQIYYIIKQQRVVIAPFKGGRERTSVGRTSYEFIIQGAPPFSGPLPKPDAQTPESIPRCRSAAGP